MSKRVTKIQQVFQHTNEPNKRRVVKVIEPIDFFLIILSLFYFKLFVKNKIRL